MRICTEFAENKGLKIIQTYSDKARTGTNDARPAFQRMLRDARTGAFQYVICDYDENDEPVDVPMPLPLKIIISTNVL